VTAAEKCVFTTLTAAVAAFLSLSASAPAAGDPRWVEPVTGIEFIRIPGGEFAMGSSAGGDDERPPHPVRLRAFYLGRFEVTQAQWRAVTGENPAHFGPCDDCPVEQVSWGDAQLFLRRASQMARVALRLPTEAEWEFAAGGGALHEPWPGTDDPEDLPAFIWFKGKFEGRTRQVGRKKPNAYSLHDLGGNVAEWCADWFDPDYYRQSAVDDPRGPVSGTRKCVRGGSFLSGPDEVRTTHRWGSDPAARRRSIGLRVARDAVE
jgi:formylglycine-generating enzyme required for sulfatase activity